MYGSYITLPGMRKYADDRNKHLLSISVSLLLVDKHSLALRFFNKLAFVAKSLGTWL